MPLILDEKPSESLTLAAFVAYLRENVNFGNIDSIASASGCFARFLLCDTVVSQAVNRELANWRMRDDAQRYIGPSVWLHRDDKFSIRANFWMPLAASQDALAFELLAYRIPHNHPKIFMTGGYRGEGYETVLFRDCGSQPERYYPGDLVELEPIGRETLSEGRIMLYEPTRDIHYQEHPHQFAISINVISEAGPRQRQYLYDVEQSSITTCVDDNSEQWIAILDAARLIHDARTISILTDIMRTKENPYTKVQCASALVDIDPAHRPLVISCLKSHTHALVREFVGRQREAIKP